MKSTSYLKLTKSIFPSCKRIKKKKTTTSYNKQIKLCPRGMNVRFFFQIHSCFRRFLIHEKKIERPKTIKMHRNTQAKFVELDWIDLPGLKILSISSLFVTREKKCTRTFNSQRTSHKLVFICHLCFHRSFDFLFVFQIFKFHGI